MAAGGIIIRHAGKPLIAVVQRRRDNAWVLPKGKLKPGETPIAAARREATEETGADVRVHEFLGVISYLGGSGPKIAHFWRMHATAGTTGRLMDDIKAVEWLPLAAATTRLSLPHEQQFLRNVGRKALRQALRKPRRKPAREQMPAPPSPVISEPLIETPAPAALSPLAPSEAASPHAKLLKPQPRWAVLARLSRRWQAAVNRTRRIG
jgi:8-oxo-dGTP diphosphatase